MRGIKLWRERLTQRVVLGRNFYFIFLLVQNGFDLVGGTSRFIKIGENEKRSLRVKIKVHLSSSRYFFPPDFSQDGRFCIITANNDALLFQMVYRPGHSTPRVAIWRRTTALDIRLTRCKFDLFPFSLLPSPLFLKLLRMKFRKFRGNGCP